MRSVVSATGHGAKQRRAPPKRVEGSWLGSRGGRGEELRQADHDQQGDDSGED